MNAFGNLNILGLACCACLGIGMASAASTPPVAELKPLKSFPEVRRLWMGLEEGSIRPGAYLQMRASAEGYLALSAKDGQHLEKDQAWATIDPEQLTLERKSLEVDQQKLDRQLKKARNDAQDLQVRLSVELHETERKRRDLVDASQESEIPAALKKRAAEAILKIDQQIELLNDKLDPESLERDQQLDEDEGELQIARKRKLFQSLEKRSCLMAPFNGDLRLSDTLKKQLAAAPNPTDLLWVKPNDLIATIVDNDRFEISVTATSPLLAQIPPAELLVFFQEGQTGRLIAGEYARTDEVDLGSEITRNYIFNIQADSAKLAAQSMGQRNLVHIYRKFTRPFRFIQKKDIAFLAPDVLAAGGWDGLIRHLWPGSEVIQVGPQAIAVKPKDEN